MGNLDLCNQGKHMYKGVLSKVGSISLAYLDLLAVDGLAVQVGDRVLGLILVGHGDEGVTLLRDENIVH
jgi:hypothetical protein